MTINPDTKDYEAIEREHGRLPAGAPIKELAHHYRLAQAQKLIRLYEAG